MCSLIRKIKYFSDKENGELPVKPRKRLRNFQLHKKVIQKHKVERGEEHLSKRGKVINKKIFCMQINCHCNLKCAEKITVERQLEIFSSYYHLSNWMNKTTFLRGCVSRKINKKKMENDLQPITCLKNRNYKHIYKLKDSNGVVHVVCQRFFLKCLQINGGRVIRALDSEAINPSAIDRRGKKIPANKTSESDLRYLNEFISNFPAYESHYGRGSSDKKYLDPNLNIVRLYREYKMKCDFSGRTVLKEAVFRREFNIKHNLEFKHRKSDACAMCEEYKIKLSEPNLDYKEKCRLENCKLVHLDMCKRKIEEFKEDIKKAENSNGSLQVLTMDLEKTLETPVLKAADFYYKRCLWTYNFCIYNEVEKKAYMYTWHEAVAGRGADEVSSCIKKHIETSVAEETEKITIYSDGCGGQNRNIKTTLMLKKILTESRNIREIEQKYFVSGHSKNNCDRMFGLIEKQKKITENIFVPNNWIDVIRQAKKKEPLFSVVKMECLDFYSSTDLTNLITNRKITKQRIKINWHDIDTIINYKNDIFSLHIKRKGDPFVHQIDIRRKHVTNNQFREIILEHTSLNGRFIKREKYNDLISMFRFIPSTFHSFYTNLKTDDQIEDYELASESENENDNEEEDK